jgi:hypothetical protein
MMDSQGGHVPGRPGPVRLSVQIVMARWQSAEKCIVVAMLPPSGECLATSIERVAAIVKLPALYAFSALLLFLVWAIVTVSPYSDAR